MTESPYIIRGGSRALSAWPFVLLLLLVGCSRETERTDFVVRVGTEFLTQEQLDDILQAVPAGRDSVAAAKQIIDQWVEQNARRLNLAQDPDVSRLLAENERSVLVSAYVNRLYDDNPIDPTPDDINRFFEVNKERLRLREPFVRIRYLHNSDRDSVVAARSELQRAMRGSDADSLWIEIVRKYSSDVAGSLALSDNHFAESRLFGALPTVRETLSRLGQREMSRVMNDGGEYHLVQLLERVPSGSVPQMRWVEDEIVRQLILQGRKQTFARAVQNLRNMATARNELEVRDQYANPIP